MLVEIALQGEYANGGHLSIVRPRGKGFTTLAAARLTAQDHCRV
jgi:hypothetical protein